MYFYSSNPLVGAPQMQQAGAGWMHTHLHWSQIERSPGVYDWSQADAILADAASKGFQPIITINGNPTWAADTVCGPIRQEHLPTFAAFLTAMASRYKQPPYNVQYWALYNEPDNSDLVNGVWIGGCWGRAHPNHAPGAGGAAYANMLSYAYPAIKAGNANAKVLMGGVAYESWYSPQQPHNPFDGLFLDEMLRRAGQTILM